MLTLSGVTHIYADGTKALDNVSLQIPKGMYGLLGPNGAGKSTLMRSIATLQTPSAGSIRFGDIDVIREPAKLRAALGYLPQDFGVYPRVTAYDLLDHLAVLKGFSRAGERRDEVEALLNQVNLWSVRKRPVAGFSGGMRQRFGVAQALIGRPSLIIVDEPTAGLDPEERNRFNNLLAQIGENVVVILSTHIVADVADLCSRTAIIHEGRIILEGNPDELTGRLDGKIWRRTVEKEALSDLTARFNVISNRLHTGRTVIHVLADQLPETGFEPVEGGLEDLYFATLTQQRRQAAA
jgi:ABC-2 type transport system ATP-binding protein